MHSIVCGVEATGVQFAHAVAEWLSPLCPEVAVQTISFEELQNAGMPAAMREHNGTTEGAILCITPSSLAEETLSFALGLLHGRVGSAGFVAPLLMDLLPEDVVRTPLGLFQVTRLAREEMMALVTDVLLRGNFSTEGALWRTGFDETWDTVYERINHIPGPQATEFTLSICLLSGIAHVRFDPSGEDAPWADAVAPVLRSLPDSPLEIAPFEPTEMLALDVEVSRWIGTPVMLSRVPTRHIALVDPTLVDQWEGDPRASARRIRGSLPSKGVSDKVIWSKEHVFLARGVG